MPVYRCGWALDASGKMRKDCKLVTEGGLIRAFEPWSAVGESYTDWSRYGVVPGFIDCHDHLGIDMGDEEVQSREDAETTTIKAMANARRILAHGVTTLRDVGEKDHHDIVWRRALRARTITGPTIYVSGQFIVRTGGHAWYCGYQADGPDAIRTAVRTQVRAGVDWIKAMITGGVSTAGLSPTHPEYSRDEVHAIVEEAHRRGRKTAVHAHGGEAVDWALEAGVDTIEHGVFLTDRQLEKLAKQHAYLVMTYEIINQGAKSPDVPAYYREKATQAIRRYLDTLAKAREHRVAIAAGGDGWHGDPCAEAKALVAAGYTPGEALAALTTTAARLLELEDRIGRLEAGHAADFVAVEGDPTTDVEAIGRVAHVIHDGVDPFANPDR